MEVHHHPEIEKKGFKEYILEGLMIFIAVFMGFIAENVRESVVEHNREKEYIREMVNNLKYDTIRCDKNIAVDEKFCLGLDTFRAELQKAIAGNIDGNKLYYLAMQYTGRVSKATFNRSAYTELRSSGSLRLISDKKLVTDISDYYDRRVAATEPVVPDALRAELRKTKEEFFNWAYFDDLIKGSSHRKANFETIYNYQKILTMKPAPNVLNTSPVALQRLYNDLAEFEIGLKNYVFFMSWCKDGAVSLMGSIQKEYHLKDE
jgi:hypothetical protein